MTARPSPQASALPDGRIGVYVGAGYLLLPLDIAHAFRAQLDAAIAQVEASIAAPPVHWVGGPGDDG